MVAERRGAAIDAIITAQSKDGVFGWPLGPPEAGKHASSPGASGLWAPAMSARGLVDQQCGHGTAWLRRASLAPWCACPVCAAPCAL